MSLQQRVVKGYFYAAIFLVGYYLIIFLSRVLLFRILTPNDFGIYNIPMAFIGILTVIGDIGVTSAIIQREGNETKIISTGTMIIMLSKGIIFVILALSSRIIANTYHESNLVNIFLLIIITQIVNIGGIPSRTIAQRYLEFKRLYITDLLKEVVAVMGSLYWALRGFGYWSLVYGRALAGIAWFILSITYVLSPFHPSFKKCFNPTLFSKRIAKDLLKLSFGFFLATATIEIIKGLIPMFAGLLLDFEAVGILSAIFFLILIFESFMTLISEVTFSAFSRIQQDHTLIQKGINKYLRYSSFFIIPYFIILETVGDSLIGIVLGEKWIPPQGVFQILAWIVLILPFGHLGTAIMKSLGKPRDIVLVNSARIITFMLVCWALVNSTIDRDNRLIGLAVGILMQYILLFGLLIALHGRYYFFKLILDNYKKPVVAALLMALWMVCLRGWIHDSLSLILITLTSLGIFYAGLYLMEGTIFIKDIHKLFLMITGRKY